MRVNLRLDGKRVLITAATEGIGLAMAKRFASEGAIVTITGRSEDRLNLAASAVTDFGSVQTLLAGAGTADGSASIIEQLPTIDVLINNLGVYAPQEFFDITDDEWCGIFQTNVISGVRLSRHNLRQMLHAGSGRIISFLARAVSSFLPAPCITG